MWSSEWKVFFRRCSHRSPPPNSKGHMFKCMCVCMVCDNAIMTSRNWINCKWQKTKRTLWSHMMCVASQNTSDEREKQIIQGENTSSIDDETKDEKIRFGFECHCNSIVLIGSNIYWTEPLTTNIVILCVHIFVYLVCPATDQMQCSNRLSHSTNGSSCKRTHQSTQ